MNPSEKYKWVDDLSIIEIVNLMSIGLATYNFHHHVASDVGIEQYFVDPQHLKSQSYLNELSEWTDRNKMKLNIEKTKIMIFNPTYNYQFMSRLTINDKIIEVIGETDLLGVKILSLIHI